MKTRRKFTEAIRSAIRDGQVVEPEAAKLVPDLPGGAPRSHRGLGARDSDPRGAHEERATEGRDRSGLPGEVPHSRSPQVREGSGPGKVEGDDHGAGAAVGEGGP